ncbi:uncharacterized protein LOC135480586 [Liolophura sinensis]|uniref:uncharacterized protein LOC135480586 n=1 Tax=Liolophura sinensis TaxID=3198878 RepID=UPI0031589BF9
MLMLLKIPDKPFSHNSLKNFFDQHSGNDIRKVVENLFYAIQTYHNEGVFQVDITEDGVIIFSPSWEVAFLSLWIIGYGGLEVKYQGGQRADIKQASSVVRRLLEEKGMKDHPIYYILDNVSELDTAASILMKISSFQNTIENVPIQESSGKILENGQKVSEVVLEIEDTSITAMDLKSLELTLSDRDLIVLQNVEPNFERGSLSEGIMIGYFKCLKEKGNTTVQVITSEDLKSNVTEEQNILSEVCWILVPWNRNKHWALIAADVERKGLIYIDPVPPSGGENQTKVQPEEWEALGKVRSLLGWTNFNTILNPPDRSMQGDPTSCGVYVCFYARQLILGKPLGAKFSPEPMRREIEATLRSEGMWEGAGGRGFPQGSA